jgi:transcriptional regulator EpsA
MNTVHAKMPCWLGGPHGVLPARWSGDAERSVKAAPQAGSRGFQLSAEESGRFLCIVSQCARIRRHYDIYSWLAGEVQHFLPHDILLSAWGDFDTWDLELDLTSGLPDVRTRELAHCQVDKIIRQAYARWRDAGRKAVLLKVADIEALQSPCDCAVHAAMRGMRNMLVHGVDDQRSGHESLFIALTGGSFTKGRSLLRFLSALDPLVALIDAAFRKVPTFPLASPRLPLREGSNVLELSTRELEVLESLCRGRTNLEIAAALYISPFTVKNHVQRIFRKIGVTNRTQAAARYADALQQAALTLAKRPVDAADASG